MIRLPQFACVCLAGVVLLTTPAPAQQRWVMAVGFPEGSLYWRHLEEFAIAVTKVPNSEVELELVFDNRAVDELVSMLQTGEIASAVIPLRALAGQFDEADIYTEPLLSRGYEATLNLAQFAALRLSPALQELGFTLLYTFPWYLHGLYSTEPLESFYELEGSKFIAYDSRSSEVAASFGAEVTISEPPAFAGAFVEGDATFASPSFGVEQDAARRYRYFYDLQILPDLYGVIVGDQFSSKLSESGRSQMSALARIAELDAWAEVERQDNSHVRMLSETGISVASPTLAMKTELEEKAAAKEERIMQSLGHSPIAVFPLRGFEPRDDCMVLEIFFATDRIRNGDGDVPYGAGPDHGELRLGKVTVGGGVAFPELREGNIACQDLELWPECRGDVEARGCLRWNELGKDEFLEQVHESEARLVFTHGYRTQMGEAAVSFHRLLQGLSAPPVPILFSWPTMKTSLGSITAYPGDRETALVSSGNLKNLIDLLAEEGGEDRVYVIGHSMGTLVTVEALRELVGGAGSEAEDENRVEQVVLIAADISKQELIDRTLPIFGEGVGRTTVYTSNNDCVLKASEVGIMFKPRVGKMPPAVLHEHMDTIDVTEANNDWSGKGHSYHLSSQEILADLSDVLKGGLLADRTNLETSPGGDGNSLLVYRRSGGPAWIASRLVDLCG
jgi:TRAP-type transport system periplasmic protein